ncbi:hypothetical protein [Nonomuraea sp. NPDC049784]
MKQVQVWDRDYRSGPGPQFAVWPINAPVEVSLSPGTSGSEGPP